MKEKGNRKVQLEKISIPAGLDNISNTINDVLSIENGKYKNLIKIISNPLILLSSFEKVTKNSGYYSVGTDNKLIITVDKEFFVQLGREINSGIFQPKPTRRVMIPKSDGRLRPLGISCSVDKVVQEAMRAVLEFIYEPKFLASSHGFRPMKSCHTAINQYKMQFSCVTWIINMDIKSCFDNIDHKVLADILCENISDKGFMDLYWKMVRAGYMFQGTHFPTIKGSPQGSIVSPILANIYLHKLDAFIHSYKESFDKGIVKRKNKIMRNLKRKHTLKVARKLNLISVDVTDSEFRRLFYIRYADDFIIGVDCCESDAKLVMLDIQKFLNDILKMQLSFKEIIKFKHNKTKFLGFYIKGIPYKERPLSVNKLGIRRRIVPRPLILFPTEKIYRKLKETGFVKYNKNIFKPTSLRSLIHHPLYNIVEYYNSVYRGIANYYRVCSNRSLLNNVHFALKTSCALTIALKMKLKTIRKVMKRYGRNLNIIENGAKISFVSIGIWKRKSISKTAVYDPIENFQKFTTFGLRSKLSKNNGCEECGSKEDLQLHHVNPRRNINKNLDFLEKVRISVQRKQVLLCRDCHNKRHHGN